MEARLEHAEESNEVLQKQIAVLEHDKKVKQREHEQALARALDPHADADGGSGSSGGSSGDGSSSSGSSSSGDGDNGGADLRKRVMEQLQALHFDANGKEVDLQVGMSMSY